MGSWKNVTFLKTVIKRKKERKKITVFLDYNHQSGSAGLQSKHKLDSPSHSDFPVLHPKQKTKHIIVLYILPKV